VCAASGDVFRVPQDGSFAQAISASPSFVVLAPGTHDIAATYGPGQHNIVAAGPGVIATVSSPVNVVAGVTVRVVGVEVRGAANSAFVVGSGGTLVVDGATFTTGLVRAVIAASGSRVVVRASQFRGTTDGALIVSTDDFVIENVLITDNLNGTAALFDGGALSTSRFAHNTITNNGSVGVECVGGMLITQSIVFDNAAQIIGACDVAESIVQGGRAGFANRNVDPLFVNDDAGDFHLGAGSPAIDASILSVQRVDVEGRARDAFPDVGAFEAP
jgi:hypothetical protein